MDAPNLDAALKVLNSCVLRIKWRLKAASKRRLEIDILALCTGLRPVVMVDYGGKVPELQEQLCTVLRLSQEEASILRPLRVMVIEDMIYLIHVKGLAEHALSSLNRDRELLYVDLEQDPPKMIVKTEESAVLMQLESIQKFFSLVFPVDGTNKDLMECPGLKVPSNVKYPVGEHIASQSSEFIDLSSCMQDTQVTVPTLNGWLLGYPVVYLFGKDHIPNAIYNLSTKPLHLFMILVCRNCPSSKERKGEELMSFSVPYDLSLGGKNEAWAQEFLTHMLVKWEGCKQAWTSLQMEVSECYPQAIVL